MFDRDEWWQRVREISVASATLSWGRYIRWKLIKHIAIFLLFYFWIVSTLGHQMVESFCRKNVLYKVFFISSILFRSPNWLRRIPVIAYKNDVFILMLLRQQKTSLLYSFLPTKVTFLLNCVFWTHSSFLRSWHFYDWPVYSLKKNCIRHSRKFSLLETIFYFK